MDLNPYKFVAPFEDFEFANYHVEQGTEIVSCCMNWLVKQLTEEDDDEAVLYNNLIAKPSTENLNYWALRMLPLIENSAGKRNLVIVCNRVGHEKRKILINLSIDHRSLDRYPVLRLELRIRNPRRKGSTIRRINTKRTRSFNCRIIHSIP